MIILIFLSLNVSIEKLPFDSQGKIYKWNSTLETKIPIFPEYHSLVSAEILKYSDGRITIRIAYKEQGKLKESKTPIMEKEYKALVKKVDDYFESHMEKNRDGWGLFLLSTLQTGLSEWSSLATIIVDNGKAYPIFAGGSFFIPMLLTMNSNITLGQAWMSWNMSHHSYVLGLSINGFIKPTWNWGDDKTYLMIPLVTSILGDYAGFQYAGKNNLSPGRAEMFSHTMLYSESYSGLLGTILLPSNFDSLSNPLLLRVPYIGLIAGYLGGFYLWHRHKEDDFTIGDAFSYDTYSLLGVLSDFTLLSYFPDRPEYKDYWKVKTLIGIGIHSVFNYYGARFFKDKNVPFLGGIAVTGGTFAGALMGIGITSLTNTEDYHNYLLSSSIGGWVGFLLTYQSARKMGKGKSGFGLNIGINPLPILYSKLYKGTPIVSISF